MQAVGLTKEVQRRRHPRPQRHLFTEPPDEPRVGRAITEALVELFAETVESESPQQPAAQADRFCTHRPGFVPILQLPHGPPCMPAFGHFSVQSGRTNLDGPGLPGKSSVPE